MDMLKPLSCPSIGKTRENCPRGGQDTSSGKDLFKAIMERIWAPWRIDYIVGGERESGCIFCSKPASEEDDRDLIVHRGPGAFTMMNKFPYNNGHVLVAPYRHAPDICQLDSEENRLLLEEVCRLHRGDFAR